MEAAGNSAVSGQTTWHQIELFDITINWQQEYTPVEAAVALAILRIKEISKSILYSEGVSTSTSGIEQSVQQVKSYFFQNWGFRYAGG